MAALRSARDPLRAWTKLDEMVRETYRVTRRFPAEERDGLGRTLRRTAVAAAMLDLPTPPLPVYRINLIFAPCAAESDQHSNVTVSVPSAKLAPPISRSTSESGSVNTRV